MTLAQRTATAVQLLGRIARTHAPAAMATSFGVEDSIARLPRLADDAISGDACDAARAPSGRAMRGRGLISAGKHALMAP